MTAQDKRTYKCRACIGTNENNSVLRNHDFSAFYAVLSTIFQCRYYPEINYFSMRRHVPLSRIIYSPWDATGGEISLVEQVLEISNEFIRGFKAVMEFKI